MAEIDSGAIGWNAGRERYLGSLNLGMFSDDEDPDGLGSSSSSVGKLSTLAFEEAASEWSAACSDDGDNPHDLGEPPPRLRGLGRSKYSLAAEFSLVFRLGTMLRLRRQGCGVVQGGLIGGRVLWLLYIYKCVVTIISEFGNLAGMGG